MGRWLISDSHRSAPSFIYISALVMRFVLCSPTCVKGKRFAAILPFAMQLSLPGVLVVDLPCVTEGGLPPLPLLKCTAYLGVGRGCVNYQKEIKRSTPSEIGHCYPPHLRRGTINYYHISHRPRAPLYAPREKTISRIPINRRSFRSRNCGTIESQCLVSKPRIQIRK